MKEEIKAALINVGIISALALGVSEGADYVQKKVNPENYVFELAEEKPEPLTAVVDEDAPKPKKFYYDVTAVCDCSSEKTIGGDGLPEYTFTDDCRTPWRVFVGLDHALYYGSIKELTEIGFCPNNGEVLNILEYRFMFYK